MKKLWRTFKWWFRCLWQGKVVPRKEAKLYSRSYMRRAWAARLRELDRNVQERTIRGMPVDFLLMERKIMVAKRRRFLFE